MPTRKLFNAKTQQVEDAEFTVDKNNEIVATFQDEGFIKFPANLTKDEFESLVADHQTANRGQESISPEEQAKMDAERQNSLDLIGDTSQEEDHTNDSTENSPNA